MSNKSGEYTQPWKSKNTSIYDQKAGHQEPKVCVTTGDAVELTLWDEMAKNSNKTKFKLMEQPVIFDVSSCKVSEYGANASERNDAARNTNTANRIK
ncbi:hypothetical protein Tco_0558472 [Tanacetum coccineum]